MTAVFTKISDFEMTIEATVDSSIVDKAIKEIVLISEEAYEEEIQIAKKIGIRFDDPKERSSWWWKVADYLSRRSLKKETEAKGIGRQDLIDFQATFEEPPRKGQPFSFKATFPYFIPTEKMPLITDRKPEIELPGVVITVVNVPITRTETEIKDLFGASGNVLAVKFLIHSRTGEKLDCVQIAFDNKDSAIDAYFRFSGSYVGHDQGMKIRFMDRGLQTGVVERGDVLHPYSAPKHYFNE
jgi:hypothetical protein